MVSRRLEQTSGTVIRFAGVCIVIALLLHGSPLLAQMEEVTETELSRVSAQAGINFNWGNSRVLVTAESIRVSDTDHDPKNWLELNEFSISGPGGYFTLDSPADDPLLFHPNTIDVGTMDTIDDETRTVVHFVQNDHRSPRTWDVGHLVFCAQDIGSVRFDTVNVDPAILSVSTHLSAGTSGIEWEYLSNWATQNFSYGYNAAGGALSVSGIHIVERAIGASDNPADPSTWELTGQFRIGDLQGGEIDVDDDPANASIPNPASFDVATVTSATPTKTCMYLNLPMKGTIRMEDVNIGGTSFGPVAIDGITVHHLGVKFDPGN